MLVITSICDEGVQEFGGRVDGRSERDETAGPQNGPAVRGMRADDHRQTGHPQTSCLDTTTFPFAPVVGPHTGTGSVRSCVSAPFGGRDSSGTAGSRRWSDRRRCPAWAGTVPLSRDQFW